jgi:hypothetical protein
MKCAALFFALTFVGTCGCGGPGNAGAQLSGRVTLDGQPIPSSAMASVTFRPAGGAKGSPVSAEIVESKYQTDEAPLGDVLASVSISIPTGKSVVNYYSQEKVPEYKVVTLIPEQNSGIPISVTSDGTHDFELKSGK